MDKTLFEEDYNLRKEEVYYKYNIVNIKKAQSLEEELFQLGEYLPNILRKFLSINYYNVMEELGVINKVMSKIGDTRKQGIINDTIEFINWIDTHETFKDLLNEDKVIELGDELELLEKDYNDLKRII